MENTEEKAKVINQFLKLSFNEKKKELLDVLAKLFGDSDAVDKLGNTVYNSNDIADEPLLVSIHSLILDAIYYSKDKQSERVVESFKKANEYFNKLKQEEDKESILAENELNDLLKSIV